METIKIPTQYFRAKTLDKARDYTNHSPLFPPVDISPSLNGRHLIPAQQRNKDGTCYMGLDWRALSSNLPIESNDTLMFCDLRGAVFDNQALSSVEFFGCRLDGASFRGTHLHSVRFIGCFSAEQSPPTDFAGAVCIDSDAKACHLNVVKPLDLERGVSQELSGLRSWPAEVVEAANQTLSESHKVREQAVIRLGKLGHPIVAPYLANLLLDHHWKVRVATVRTLGQLRDQVPFSYRDQVLLKWLFLR